jgi:methionine-rich copper-binding protein CopC
LVLTPIAARAHSEIESTRPREGARILKVPSVVVVEVTQEAADARLTVTDGCGEKVSKKTAIKGETISVPLRDAEPGRWRVRFQSVSALDDDIVEDSFAFQVKGKRDCSDDEDEPKASPSPPPSPSDDDAGATEDGGQATGATDDNGGSTLVLPIAIVAVAVVLTAGLLIRRRNSG